MEAKGVGFDPDTGVSIEQVRDNFQRIVDMSGCQELPDSDAEGTLRIYPNLERRSASG